MEMVTGKFIKPILVLYLILMFTNAIKAQVDSSLAVNLDVSLLELTSFDITVASKNPEEIQEAPGVITAYNSNELDYLGYYTIRDLADITPGYSSYRSIGEITLETRGQKASGFDNNNHLLLIDGLPIYHARAGKVNVEEDLPLYFAKQVEFLRGTGSALYGAGAFYGVINVVPKDLNDVKEVEAESKVSVGFPDFRRRVMANVIIPHDLGISTINLGYSAKDASLTLLGKDSTNVESVNRDNSKSTFIRLNHQFNKGKLRGFKLGFITNSKTGGMGDYWARYQNFTVELQELTWEQLIPYIKYERKLSEQFSVSSYILENISTEKGITTTANLDTGVLPSDSSIISQYKLRVYDFEALGEVSYSPKCKKCEQSKNSLNIRFGLNYVSRFQGGAPNTYANFIYLNRAPYIRRDTVLYKNKSDSYHIYSSYVQLQQKINKILKGVTVTLGLRYDGLNILSSNDRSQIDYFNRFSPRVALVQKITNKFTFKALYGSALRAAPLLKIRWVNLETIAKYPQHKDQIETNLQPTVIQSTEFLLGYKSPAFSGEITYFINKTENDIIRVNVPGANIEGTVFANSSSIIRANGSEVELSFIPKKDHVNIKVNWSYSEPSTSGNTKIVDVPAHKLNGMVYLKLNKKIPLNLGLAHHYVTGFRAPDNKSLNGYQSTDVNIRYFISSQFAIELLTRNVFNTKYYYPSFDGSGRPSVQGDSRSLLLSMNFDF